MRHDVPGPLGGAPSSSEELGDFERVIAMSDFDDEYDPGVAQCVDCGCTEDDPCPGGCFWVASGSGMEDLCSRCYALRQQARAEAQS
jgi:hypothetical protein